MQHFITEQHKNNGLSVVALEVLQPKAGIDIQKLLLQRESLWIFRLGSLTPNGLNSELDLSSFL